MHTLVLLEYAYCSTRIFLFEEQPRIKNYPRIINRNLKISNLSEHEICSLYSDKNLKCSNLARKVELNIILKYYTPSIYIYVSYDTSRTHTTLV